MSHKFPESIVEAAELLDRVEPTWYQEIDCSRLDMRHHDSCILGQLYGWCEGKKRLFNNTYPYSRSNDDPIFGNHADEGIWRREIKLRKELKESTPVSHIDINKEKPSIQVSVPKSIIAKLVLRYINEEMGMGRVKLEDVEPDIKSHYDDPPEFDGFKATVFVG